MTRARDMDHEMDMMRNEGEKEARHLRDELAAERDVIETQIKQITCMKKVSQHFITCMAHSHFL